ncbi:TIGR03620 family F420-dependent LLM class oxidoreductase [Streptomyces cinereospinus]|uniref:TIGR03620 family F420-dependent LLM class oxidoreductase n=1 Tax=Streptomyces cinereospinus TaxID=285561 RepID=A0ABV5MXR2_9ACTN
MNARTPAVAGAAARIGPVGVWWGSHDRVPADQVRAAAAEAERLGYGALWIGEAPGGREVFTHAALLLDATRHITVAPAIANIWLRDPTAARSAAAALTDAHPQRFILGLGASHAAALELIGRPYGKPLTAMRAYLKAMADSWYAGPEPDQPVPVVLAALRTRMQELARDAADGMHSCFVTPEHTAAARATLGPGPLLVPEQAVVVGSDRERARRTARRHVASRLGLTHYVRHLKAMGFTDDDLADGGSDHLVDALVATGDEETVTRRVRAHLDAGADHVAVHPLGHRADRAGLEQLRALAPVLGLGDPKPASIS